MARLLGGVFGVWLIYALLSLCFKHKFGFPIANILSVLSGFSQLLINGDAFNLISAVIAIVCIYFIIPLQIKSEKKEQWKQQRKNNT